MKLIIAFLAATLALSACSNKLEKERELKFSCTHDVTTYIVTAKEIVTQGGFNVDFENQEEGRLTAEKSFLTGKDSVSIFIDVNINDKRDVRIRTTALINAGKRSKTREFYDLENYNKDYEQNFFQTLRSLKDFCIGPKFPNRP